MAETPKPAQPVGRGRRIAGTILMVLGVVLWADMLWLFMAAPAFGYEEWLRFWVCLWTATVFVLVGYWLRSRSRPALWSAVLVFVGEVAFLVWFDHWVHMQPVPL